MIICSLCNAAKPQYFNGKDGIYIPCRYIYCNLPFVNQPLYLFRYHLFCTLIDMRLYSINYVVYFYFLVSVDCNNKRLFCTGKRFGGC